jgi:uncharacterized protein
LIFADTGAFVALYCAPDQHHGEAVRLWPQINPPVLTVNLVMGEVGNLLSQRLGSGQAADRLADIYASPGIDVVLSTRGDEREALLWMRRFADQRVGFTDCVSFAFMRRYRIRTAFTFDRHFRLAGFEVLGLK